jgi:hypothetical protein
MNTKQRQLEDRIETVKMALAALGRLRPGSLSKQARARGSGYFQITYALRGKMRCEYVRVDYEPVIRAEIETYRRYRQLLRQWIELELKLSRLKQKAATRMAATKARSNAAGPGGTTP